MKEAEAESNYPRAFNREPSGASTNTLQVISSEFWARQVAVLEGMSGVLGRFDRGGERGVTLLSM